MPLWAALLATAAYMFGLFVLAWRTDRSAAAGQVQSPTVYALSLGVYCTSWTYYGAVGTAERSGWDYLPIYLGPAIVFIFFFPLLRRIADVVRQESITSLSDFVSARYGRSRMLASGVTLAATLGALPYIALQLKSIAMSFAALTGGEGGDAPANDAMLLTAIALAAFAILFGARHADATRSNPGMVRVIAFESVFKLAALGLVAFLSLSILLDQPADAVRDEAERFSPGAGFSLDFVTLILLSMAAIFCLPRQFHVGFIERSDPQSMWRARWLFPVYLAATCLFAIPITLAGSMVLPAGAQPDLYVLDLPRQAGQSLMALLVFLGGFSAATGMAIVAAVALSTMVTNDLIVPLVMRRQPSSAQPSNFGPLLISIRRGVIVVLMLFAWLYARLASESGALADIGLLAFAAAVQFAPALIGAVTWRGGHRNGALVGLAVGMAVWLYTLFLPAVFGADSFRAAGLNGALDPQGLLGLGGLSPLTHGVLVSLTLNVALFILISMTASTRLRDRVQAVVFSGESARGALASGRPTDMQAVDTRVGDLKALAQRFLSPEAVDHAFTAFARETGVGTAPTDAADWRLVQRTERLLASALGAPSARIVLASALADTAVSLSDVLSMLDEKTHESRFDRHLLQATLESLSVGVHVCDGQQRLIAWNSAYLDMFTYPAGMIRVGRPIADLIKYNAETGFLGPGEAGTLVTERVEFMRSGRHSVFERPTSDGRYIRITGNPMPGGGYVTVFTDVTEDRLRERELKEINETLETRVSDRTAALAAMAQDLDQALKDAEGANASKTRFLAAASHDLLQPLNAARLFVGALESDTEMDAQERISLAEKADRSIESANQLLTGLLDISKLDHGGRTAQARRLPLGPVMEDLVDEARPMIEAAGLEVRLAPTSLVAFADPDFLQSILRNFISNARRYTASGRILVGARRRGEQVRIEVWDTGPGIPKDRQDEIFEEFRRLRETDTSGVRGAGLGLAVARRMAGLMGAEIGLRSVVGRGSVFSVTLPRAELKVVADRAKPVVSRAKPATDLNGLHVLCVDDEPAILEAMSGLVARWGGNVLTARTGAEAVAKARRGPIDAILIDYQLADGETGFDVIASLSRVRADLPPVALITANRSEDVQNRADARGFKLIHKPVAPDAVRAFFATLSKVKTRGHAADD